MNNFGVYIMLGMMDLMVSRVKQSIWKCFFNYGTRFGKFWVVVGELVMEWLKRR